MPDDRIIELLERWEDERQRGNDIPVEDICRGCPDLVETVRQRIEALKATEWLENPVDDDPAAELRSRTPQDFGLPATLGRYRLDELIGLGGFGQVWRAHDPELQRVVAVKVPRPDRFPTSQQAESFLSEARKLAQLKHPGIVPVYDVGHEGAHCFIVSQFVNGGNLADRIANDRPRHQESALLVAQVAEILHYAHQQGFVHRDVKPANILLGEDEKPVVADFGIAFTKEEIQHGHGDTTGTLAYMSPEQIQGDAQSLDARTDVYSLGVVLYELVAGQLPFGGSNPVHLRENILSALPEPPRAIDDSVSPELERACLKALSKKAQDRFSTAKDFAAALRAAVAPKKRKWPIKAATSLVVVAFAGIGLWLVGEYRRAQRAGDEATKVGQDAAVEVDRRLRKEFGFGIDARPAQTQIARTAGPLRLAVTEAVIDLTGREVTDEDFRTLGKQLMLRRLVLANTPTTDGQLSHLRSNSMLESLDLSGTEISDAGLEALTDLPSLMNLNLTETGISDAGLKHLGPMHLRSLNLHGTKNTDAGLACLADQYGAGGFLTELDLTGTAVGDPGVEHLEKIKRLERLHVGKTQITSEGLKRLRTALPKCGVE